MPDLALEVKPHRNAEGRRQNAEYWFAPALGFRCRSFCILHSAFCIRPAVALMWLGGRMRDAWEWLAVGLQMACRWLGDGLGWLGPPLLREGERAREPKHFRAEEETRARADARSSERPPE